MVFIYLQSTLQHDLMVMFNWMDYIHFLVYQTIIIRTKTSVYGMLRSLFDVISSEIRRSFLEIVERSTQFQNMLSNKVINIISTIKVSLSAVKRKLIPAQGKVWLSLRLGKQHRHSTPPVSPRTHRTDPHLRPAERRLDTLAEQGVLSNFIAGRHVASVCCYAWQREQESPNCGITWASRKTTASTNCCSVFQGVGPSDGRALQCFAAKQKYRPCFGMAHLVNLSLPYCI